LKTLLDEIALMVFVIAVYVVLPVAIIGGSEDSFGFRNSVGNLNRADSDPGYSHRRNVAARVSSHVLSAVAI
jgi:hypothetical protein